MSANNKKPRRWKENNPYERHYCELCNAWMSSDKQSILSHENGGRHKHNARQAEIEKRKAAEQQEKDQALLSTSLATMEAAAIASIQKDYGLFAGTSVTLPLAQTRVTAPPRPAPVPSRPPVTSARATQPEMTKSDWDERKRAREEERRKKRCGDDDEDAKRLKVTIGAEEGWYTDTNNTTWLEGIVFGDILEAEMPIQLWRGHASATVNEKRMSSESHWQDAIVAAVRARPSSMLHADRLVLDVSYLKSGDDEEMLEKSIQLANVRLRLGNPLDTRIPPTIEQARLLAMGGEEEDVEVRESDAFVDEATGLSPWATVKVSRTTELLEEKQKREEIRERNESRKQAAAEAESRRLQEVAHAPDSALGAYDVWGKQGGGYKGVNIERNMQVDAEATSKKLSAGPVAFKKGSTKKRNKRENRRTTTADD